MKAELEQMTGQGAVPPEFVTMGLSDTVKRFGMSAERPARTADSDFGGIVSGMTPI